jgi:hypothetical protein
MTPTCGYCGAERRTVARRVLVVDAGGRAAEYCDYWCVAQQIRRLQAATAAGIRDEAEGMVRWARR